jgi:membrane peptidoglycan carboxypeptidase
MSDKPTKTFGNILKLIGLSVVAGILGTGLLAPAVTLGGFAASTGLALFQTIPDYIKPVNASDASNIYAADGSKVASFFEENRISVPLSAISKNIQNAVISTEDPRFYQHDGVDWISLLRATATNIASAGNGPGASTITMQYVKNAQVTAAQQAGKPTEEYTQGGLQGLKRKIEQIRMALALEKAVTKQDILAGYLNLSFFGGTVYGIEAASNYYFGVHASQLTIPQAAMLGAMLKSPNDYRPDNAANLPAAKGRRDYVIDNMASAGYISKSAADKAKATPIVVNVTNEKAGCEADQTTAFFCDFVVWTIRNSPEFGPTQADRELLLRRGGLDIYTTMDPKLQATADAAEKKWVPPTTPSQIGSASVSVQVGTGRILALAQNRIYDQTDSKLPGHTSVNYSTDKAYGGSSGFQVGSTYKVFTLADWLANGHHLMDKVDGRVKNYQATDFSARCGTIGGEWQPNNLTKEPTNPTVVQATAISENTAFANMASKLDLCDIRDTAAAFGVHRADGNELVYYPSSILGVNEISPLTIAAAFAGISNNGMYCTPIVLDHVIQRATQQNLTVPQSTCSQAVSPEVDHGMIYAMHAVMSGTAGASNTGDGAFLGAKTGTTDSGVHTWMSGFSSTVATSTWVGNVVGSKSLSGIQLNKKAANTVRHDIWRTIMQQANKLYPPAKTMPAPAQDMIDSPGIVIPNLAGLNPDAAISTLVTAGLYGQVAVKKVGSNQPTGTVAVASPPVGKVVSTGTLVTIYVSRGGQSIVPDVSGKSVKDATATLTAAGFSAVASPQPSEVQYFVHSSSVPKDYVVATNPAAGTSAPSTAAILLIISLGP